MSNFKSEAFKCAYMFLLTWQSSGLQVEMAELEIVRESIAWSRVTTWKRILL